MRTITARIDQAAISKVGLFFDASDRQIVDEMLQNARRAGATRVDVRIAGPHVEMTDDGPGIADPQTLLSFGESDWSLAVTEKAAGMGFFSLALRNACVESRHAGGDGWRVLLYPEHFRGVTPAKVLPDPGAPAPRGTRVTFPHHEHEKEIARTIADAARHCPLTVTIDGKAVERSDFLEHAVHVSDYEGVRIGVFHDGKTHNRGHINFHGIRVYCAELPTVYPVSERGGRIATPWTTAVDVVDCPQLALVLPRRHKPVRNEFLKRVARTCRNTIYHAVLEHGDDTRLKRADQDAAFVDEIPIPTPPAELEPWTPGSRKEDGIGVDLTRRGTRSVYGTWNPSPLVMDVLPEYAVAQIAARALDQAGMLGNVFDPVPAYDGYFWYDELDRITGITVTATTDGKTERLMDDEAEQPAGHLGAITRVDRIAVTLQIGNRFADTKRNVVLETDVAFTGEQAEHHDEIGIALTNNATVTASELAAMMMNAYFTPSLEGGEDSIETQERYHETEYARIATEATGSPAAARRQYLERLGETALGSELRAGESVTVERGADNRTSVQVALATSGAGAPGPAPTKPRTHRKDTEP